MRVHGWIIGLCLVFGLAWLALEGVDGGPPVEGRDAVRTEADQGGSTPLPAAEDKFAPLDREDEVVDPREAVPAPGDSPAASGDEDPPCLIVGRVTDASGSPLPGADVHIGRLGFEPGVQGMRGMGPNGSGVDGRFEIAVDGFKPRLRIVVGAHGFAPLELSRTVPAGSTRMDFGDVVLARGVRLSGVVVDDAGRAVEAAKLRHVPPPVPGQINFGGDPFRRIPPETDATGHFEITRLANGPFEFQVTCPGYASASLRGQTDQPGEQLAGLEVTLIKGSPIEGRVLGLPTDSADVEVIAHFVDGDDPDLAMVFPPRMETKVGANGRFRFDGLNPGGTFELSLMDGSARWSGFGRRSAKVRVAAGTLNATLEFTEGASLTFTLVDAAGAPITMGARAKGGYEHAGAPINLHRDLGVPGRYEVRSLWSEGSPAFQLHITANGYGTFQVPPLTIVDNGHQDLGTIRLQKAPQLTVTVVEAASGQGVPGATVELALSPVPNGTSEISRITDEAGVATFKVIPGQRATAYVKGTAFADAIHGPLGLAPDSTTFDMRIPLELAGAVAVRVVDVDGEPTTDFLVERDLGAEAFDPVVAPLDDRGQVRIEGLGPGEHRFRLRRRRGSSDRILFGIQRRQEGGHNTPWTSVEVTPDQVASLVLEAPLLHTIHGAVTEDGQPLAGARVRRANGDTTSITNILLGLEGGDLTAVTDARGHYRITGFDGGEQTLLVSHPNRAMEHAVTVKLTEREQRVDIPLRITTVGGIVRGPDGSPIPGAEVRATLKDGGAGSISINVGVVGDASSTPGFGQGSANTSTHTDDEGRFELRGVVHGVEIQLVAQHPELGRARSAPLTMRPGARRTDADVHYPER